MISESNRTQIVISVTSVVVECVVVSSYRSRIAIAITAYRVRLLQAIEQPFLVTVREVLGHKYTAYLDRLYRKVIHFILSLLIVGFKQTFTTTTHAQRNDDTNSAASTSSTVELVSSSTRKSDSHCSNTTNNNNSSSSSSSRRVKNCW